MVHQPVIYQKRNFSKTIRAVADKRFVVPEQTESLLIKDRGQNSSKIATGFEQALVVRTSGVECRCRIVAQHPVLDDQCGDRCV